MCVDSGLITASRFPILEHDFLCFNNGCNSDITSNKGVLYTKILIKDSILHLFNVHMQASYITKDPKEI